MKTPARMFWPNLPSDSTHETPWIQSALWIKLMFHRVHERQRVASVSPCVERRQRRRPMQNDKRATLAFKLCAQLLQHRSEILRRTIQPEAADSECLNNRLPARLVLRFEALNIFESLRDFS